MIGNKILHIKADINSFLFLFLYSLPRKGCLTYFRTDEERTFNTILHIKADINSFLVLFLYSLPMKCCLTYFRTDEERTFNTILHTCLSCC